MREATPAPDPDRRMAELLAADPDKIVRTYRRIACIARAIALTSGTAAQHRRIKRRGTIATRAAPPRNRAAVVEPAHGALCGSCPWRNARAAGPEHADAWFGHHLAPRLRRHATAWASEKHLRARLRAERVLNTLPTSAGAGAP